MNLNEGQEKVAQFRDGACIVIANAGSGKSTTAIERIRRMVEEGIPQDKICITSFSRKSGEDLKKKLSKQGLNGVVTGTYHSLCIRVLQQEGIDVIENIIKEYEKDNILRMVNRELTGGEITELKLAIGLQKNNMIPVGGDYIEVNEISKEELHPYYKRYEIEKKKRGKLDWEDVLLMAYDILKEKQVIEFDYLMVDEAQDNSLIQFALMNLLCPKKNIMIIGDYNQSIYGFRGSSAKLFLDFPNKYENTTAIHMNVNYRSTSNIVQKSNDFIREYNSSNELYKDAIANTEQKGEIQLFSSPSKEEEAIKIVDEIQDKLKSGVKPEDIAIIYRNNSNSFEIENELKVRNIPYFINSEDGSFFNRKEISFIMCVLRLIDDLNDDGAFDVIFTTRMYPFTYLSNNLKNDIFELSAKKDISSFEACEVVNTTKSYEKKALEDFRKIILNLIAQSKKVDLETLIDNIIKVFRVRYFIRDKYTEEQVEERLESLSSLKKFVRNNTLESFLKFVYESGNSQKKKKPEDVELMTIHKSKGLEFENVYLVGVEQGKFPSNRGSLSEESKLFYVAVTRPKTNLYISEIGTDDLFTNQYFNK